MSWDYVHGYASAEQERLFAQAEHIVTWETAEDFAASRAKGANLPGIKAFFDAIDGLASAEEGTLADAPG